MHVRKTAKLGEIMNLICMIEKRSTETAKQCGECVDLNAKGGKHMNLICAINPTKY